MDIDVCPQLQQLEETGHVLQLQQKQQQQQQGLYRLLQLTVTPFTAPLSDFYLTIPIDLTASVSH